MSGKRKGADEDGDEKSKRLKSEKVYSTNVILTTVEFQSYLDRSVLKAILLCDLPMDNSVSYGETNPLLAWASFDYDGKFSDQNGMTRLFQTIINIGGEKWLITRNDNGLLPIHAALDTQFEILVEWLVEQPKTFIAEILSFAPIRTSQIPFVRALHMFATQQASLITPGTLQLLFLHTPNCDMLLDQAKKGEISSPYDRFILCYHLHDNDLSLTVRLRSTYFQYCLPATVKSYDLKSLNNTKEHYHVDPNWNPIFDWATSTGNRKSLRDTFSALMSSGAGKFCFQEVRGVLPIHATSPTQFVIMLDWLFCVCTDKEMSSLLVPTTSHSVLSLAIQNYVDKYVETESINRLISLCPISSFKWKSPTTGLNPIGIMLSARPLVGHWHSVLVRLIIHSPIALLQSKGEYGNLDICSIDILTAVHELAMTITEEDDSKVILSRSLYSSVFQSYLKLGNRSGALMIYDSRVFSIDNSRSYPLNNDCPIQSWWKLSFVNREEAQLLFDCFLKTGAKDRLLFPTTALPDTYGYYPAYQFEIFMQYLDNDPLLKRTVLRKSMPTELLIRHALPGNVATIISMLSDDELKRASSTNNKSVLQRVIDLGEMHREILLQLLCRMPLVNPHSATVGANVSSFSSFSSCAVQLLETAKYLYLANSKGCSVTDFGTALRATLFQFDMIMSEYDGRPAPKCDLPMDNSRIWSNRIDPASNLWSVWVNSRNEILNLFQRLLKSNCDPRLLFQRDATTNKVPFELISADHLGVIVKEWLSKCSSEERKTLLASTPDHSPLFTVLSLSETEEDHIYMIMDDTPNADLNWRLPMGKTTILQELIYTNQDELAIRLLRRVEFINPYQVDIAPKNASPIMRTTLLAVLKKARELHTLFTGKLQSQFLISTPLVLPLLAIISSFLY